MQEIFVIDKENKYCDCLQKMFKNEDYKFYNYKEDQLDIALRNIPSLFIINEDSMDFDSCKICDKIRKDEDNSITPIIVLSSNREKEHRLKILDIGVEYYIRKPVDNDYLFHTIKNLMRLMFTNRRVSPLTGLPGNVQITAELKKRVANKEDFGVLYADLDNFKEYNDVYGFIKGDEIIKFTARTLIRNVHKLKNNNSFIGHIGGDDFIIILSKTNYEKICQNIIAEFDKYVEQYFTEEDYENGYIEVANRKGIIEEFPITSISIGIVEADAGRFKNILEIGEIGAQVKHAAKTIIGSSYAVNRRKKTGG